MKLLGIIDTDHVNYKKLAMVLEFPRCTFKCNKGHKNPICQNFHLASCSANDYNIDDIIKMYEDNPVVEALVFQGLEPFDSFIDVLKLVKTFRKKFDDDIVIYTGYTVNESLEYIKALQAYTNIIVKFGRYKPNHEPHFDEVLGVNLVSDNQFAMNLDDINTSEN